MRNRLGQRLTMPIWFGLLAASVVAMTRFQPTRISVPTGSLDTIAAWIAHVPRDQLAIEFVKLITLGISAWLLLASTLVMVVRFASPKNMLSVCRLLPTIARPIFRPAAVLAVSGSLLLSSSSFAAADEVGVDHVEAPVLIHLGTAPDASAEAPPSTEVDTDIEPPEMTHLDPATRLDRAHVVLTAPVHAQFVAATADNRWVVEPGDHFWSIASRVVAAAGDGSPSPWQVGEYWLRLVETNRAALPDPSNPDLMYPGMRLLLPAV